MKLIITPEDLILRCLWSNYRKFVLHDKTENEIREIIEKNEATLINEDDSYAIGLLKIIETDNLIHRFNQHILEILHLKSNVYNEDIYINKPIIIREIVPYKNRFPSYYTPPINYKNAIDDLMIYIDNLSTNIDNLKVLNVKIKDKNYEYILSKEIKKQLKM